VVPLTPDAAAAQPDHELPPLVLYWYSRSYAVAPGTEGQVRRTLLSPDTLAVGAPGVLGVVAAVIVPVVVLVLVPAAFRAVTRNW
jgi:hypothetical protein